MAAAGRGSHPMPGVAPHLRARVLVAAFQQPLAAPPAHTAVRAFNRPLSTAAPPSAEQGGASGEPGAHGADAAPRISRRRRVAQGRAGGGGRRRSGSDAPAKLSAERSFQQMLDDLPFDEAVDLPGREAPMTTRDNPYLGRAVTATRTAPTPPPALMAGISELLKGRNLVYLAEEHQAHAEALSKRFQGALRAVNESRKMPGVKVSMGITQHHAASRSIAPRVASHGGYDD